MRIQNFLKLAMMAVVGVALSHTAAYAAVTPTLLLCADDGGSCFAADSVYIIENGGAPIDSTPAATGTTGTLSPTYGATDLGLSDSLGSNITVTSDLGTLPDGGIDLEYGVVFSGAATINIIFAANQFMGDVGMASFVADTTGTNNGTTTTQTACFGPGSTGLSELIMTCSAPYIVNVTSSAASIPDSTGTGIVNTANPFGLEEEVTITSTGAGNASGDFQLLPTPEPTSILLLGGVLGLIGMALRRKLQNA